MTQFVDIQYRERAESVPINKRFKDITGPAILAGYRLGLGNEPFSISLLRGGHSSSIAITPSGARVEETQDIPDAVLIEPNDLNTGEPRIDSVYLTYAFGTPDAVAGYTVVTGIGGSGVPSDNPNPQTHLLLGYVAVPPGGVAPTLQDLKSRPHGMHTLEVAHASIFHGESTFEEKVVFKKPVEFEGGTSGTEDPNASFIEQLTYPILAAPGQQVFTLPKPYKIKTNSIEVYKDWVLQPPSAYDESSPTTIKFHEECDGGEKIWMRWYGNISFYTPDEHDHDDLYYRKNDVNNRTPHPFTDYFAGMNGRVIHHYLGTTNYMLTTPIAVEKSADVGIVSVEKAANQFVVYNTGTYRGQFEILLIMNQPHQYMPNDEDIGFFTVVASDLDATVNSYRQVDYKRKNGTLYLRTTLQNFDARGYYRRLHMAFYNTSGTEVIKTMMYALDYDEKGLCYSKTLITDDLDLNV